MVSPIKTLASGVENSRLPDASRQAGGVRPGPEQAADKAASSRGLGDVRTPADAIQALRIRLEQQLESRLGRLDSPALAGARFEPPTAADVAGRILGFVQARLQKEADAGADPQRLADLMAQARKGVEQGFSEARDQIRAMGLMTGQLSGDIDDSYSRVQEGLGRLEDHWLGSAADSSQPGAVADIRSALVASASRNSFSFEVTTAEGDRVRVRMEERQQMAAGQQSVSDGRSTAVASQQFSQFSGRYEFTVEGHLSEAERGALSALFEDVQAVAGRFFEGDVQGAFAAARSLDLTGNELAGFSLNLTSSRTVTAAAYESVASQPSLSSQLRPLGGLARDIQALGQQGLQAGVDLSALTELTRRLMADMQDRVQGAEQPAGSLMSDFLSSILQSVQPEA